MSWSILVLLGCGNTTESPPAPPAPEPVAATPGMPNAWSEHLLARPMQKHFASATEAVWYVAVGDLGQMRAQVEELRQQNSYEALDASLRPLADDLKTAASAWSAATDREQAARQSAAVAERCAACHDRSGTIPRLTQDELRIPELTEKGEHILAPYLLWVGLLVPSDLAWTVGAELLGLPGDGAADTPHRAAYEAVALRARSATSATRGAIWSELLAGCEPCHDAVGTNIEDPSASP